MVAADLTDDWDPRDPEVLEDQLRAYDRRRTGCPVAHSDYLGWSIFRHEDVVAIAEDATTYSSAVSVAHPAVPNGYDPPQHDTYRQIVDHYFSPEQMARFEPLCRVVVMELTETLPCNERGRVHQPLRADLRPAGTARVAGVAALHRGSTSRLDGEEPSRHTRARSRSHGRSGHRLRWDCSSSHSRQACTASGCRQRHHQPTSA